MLRPVTVRILAFAACGWLLATDAGALTLGRAHGAALIGRPLEVSIPITLDGASAEMPCASAEVFYGDTRAATPTVRLEPAGPGQATVHVLSSAGVDEPIVTVYLKVGCTQASTRRYVLLSEPPPADEPAARAVRTVPVPPPVAAVAPAPVETRPPRPDAARSAPAVAPSGAPRHQVAAKAAPTSRARKAAPQARLRLEPLDLGIERDPVLRLSNDLAAPAAVDPQRRLEIAALWSALQRSPEQSADEIVRLQSMQRDLDAVREISRQNAAELARLRLDVEQARSGRATANSLVTALALVLAGLLAAIAWRWHRRRQLERVGSWFEANGDAAQGQAPAKPEAPRTPAPAVMTPNQAVIAGAAATAAIAPRAPAPASAPGATWTGAEDFGASRGGSMRTVGVEELIDIHDKADFFLSIGETGQAVAALEAHVHDQVDTGALAWLELLELYHSLGRRTEFERLRSEFRQRFLAQVPDFEHFDQPSPSLEHYGRALGRIVALWPSPKVLEVIAESIFRRPSGAGSEPFTLEAYRELVLLYHIARDMAENVQAESPGNGAVKYSDTSPQPLNPALDVALDRDFEPPLTDQERLMIPPSSARLGVDIDIDEAEDSVRADMPVLDFDISTVDAGLSAQEDKER